MGMWPTYDTALRFQLDKDGQMVKLSFVDEDQVKKYCIRRHDKKENFQAGKTASALLRNRTGFRFPMQFVFLFVFCFVLRRLYTALVRSASCNVKIFV